MNKKTNEWTLDFDWGKVALASWGDPTKPPILMVHGYMDSAATFIPLLEYLPDKYYYVGFDMPGHGKSDPFPPGVIISQMHMVEVIRGIVKEMKWKSFMYISHSMGFIIGVFYNHIFPGKITKMVHIDPALPIAGYYHTHHHMDTWYIHLFDSYYSNYDRWNSVSTRQLTQDEAINLLVRNRDISEDKAELVLSRSLVPVSEGKFRLSWEQRMKKIASVPLSEETLFTIITQHTPPMLIVEASDSIHASSGKKFADNILKKCKLMVPNFYTVTVDGGHDVHITNPDEVATHVTKFLKGKKGYIKKLLSKL